MHIGYVLICRKRTDGIGEQFRRSPRDFTRAFKRLGKSTCTWVIEEKCRRIGRVKKNVAGWIKKDEMNVADENEPTHASTSMRNLFILKTHVIGSRIGASYISL